MSELAASRFDFGRIASRYDAWYRTPRGVMYDRLEKKTIDRLLPPASSGGRLLEVGCGTGHWSEYFLQRGFEVRGVDVSESMVAIARRREIAVNFGVADAMQLPFVDESFDVAAAITVLEFAADAPTVVSEMARCVRKNGGTLIIGALNRLSANNQRKQRQANSMYASARMLSPSEMDALLTPFGEPTVRVAGFVPQTDRTVWLSPLLERIGGLTRGERGAFLAARVVL
jgi:ubiquinone/menaquinone biosynthesis C-methylase UbiE